MRSVETLLEWLGSGVDRGLERLDTLIERRFAAPDRPRGPLPYLLVAPAALILGLFGLFPLAYAFYLSLFSGPSRGLTSGAATTGRSGNFVGADHYREALTDPSFWDAALVTVYYACGTVLPALVLSFLVANALFRLTRFSGTLRTFYFLPYVTAIVAAAMVWREMFEPRGGIINHLIGLVGVDAQTWLLEPRGVLSLVTDGFIPPDVGPSLALCVVMLFEVWRSSGFMIVLFLAALSAIPRELEEAARIDGAGAFHVARSVTLPMISPTIFFLSVVGVIQSFQAFSNVYALTGNGRGPLDTTQNLTVYIFTNFYSRINYGATVAVLLAVAIIGLTLLQWRFVGRRVFYQ